MRRNALVIGGSSDIGKAILEVLASNNYDITFTYYSNYDKAIEIRDMLISRYSVNVDLCYLDISDDDSINFLYQRFASYDNELNVLLNASGICLDDYYKNKKREDFIRVLDVNLVGPFLIMQKFGEIVRDVIINIASTDGIDTYNAYSIDYAASKAGLINMSKNMAMVLPTRVISLALNYVDTSSVKKMDKAFLDSELKRIGQKKLIKVSDVGLKIIDIINDKKIPSGSIIRMDG